MCQTKVIDSFSRVQILGLLNFEDESNSLSRNYGKKLSLCSTQYNRSTLFLYTATRSVIKITLIKNYDKIIICVSAVPQRIISTFTSQLRQNSPLIFADGNWNQR
jgi:hypothetical protein